MKVYIAGKITGRENYKEEFKAAEDKLVSEGFTALNPALMPDGFDQTEYHHVNRAMIDICDAVYFLPTWVDSKGSHMEMGYAMGTDKIIMHAEKTE